MKKLLLLFIFVALFYSCESPTDGSDVQNYYVIVYNKTGETLTELNVKHIDSISWGNNLTVENIPNYYSLNIDLPDDLSPKYDVRAVGSSGQEYYFWNLDVNYNNIALTNNNLGTDTVSLTPASLRIYNQTSFVITELYISHDTDQSFGANQITENLAIGEYRDFNVSTDDTPLFDIKAVDVDGYEYFFWLLDVSRNDLTITIEYLD